MKQSPWYVGNADNNKQARLNCIRHPESNLIPRIVLTASRQISDVQQAYKLGVNSNLVKPGSYQRLTKMLKLTLEYWEMCEKPKLPPNC